MTTSGEKAYFSRLIPQNPHTEWETTKISNICSFQNGDGLKSDERESGNIPVYGSNGRVGYHDKAITGSPVIIVGRKGSAGEINYSETPSFVIDTAYYVDPQSIDCNIKWLYYVLLSLKLEEQSEHSAVPGINRKFIESHIIPHPDIDTQEEIAGILDQHVSGIQNLIQKKKKILELLAEKRQAVLDKFYERAENEGSYVRLKYLADFLPGFAFPSDKFSNNSEDIRLLRGTNVGVREISWEDVVYWPEEQMTDYKDYLLEPGDIVLGMDRPWISDGIRIAQINESDSPALLVQRVLRIRAKSGTYQDYVQMMLENDRFRQYFDPITTGVSVPHISQEQVGEFEIPLPPKSCQSSILSEWRDYQTKERQLRNATVDSIDFLQEKRHALITKAVTGQIDLSDWQPPDEQEALA